MKKNINIKKFVSQKILPIFMQLPPNFFSSFFPWPLKTNQNSTTSYIMHLKPKWTTDTKCLFRSVFILCIFMNFCCLGKRGNPAGIIRQRKGLILRMNTSSWTFSWMTQLSTLSWTKSKQAVKTKRFTWEKLTVSESLSAPMFCYFPGKGVF